MKINFLLATIRSHLKIHLRLKIGLKLELDLKFDNGLSQSEIELGSKHISDWLKSVIDLRFVSD